MGTDIGTWPTEFLELKRLDMLLKCGICYDYMNTCMITSCCHNYCSLCIRKFMQYKTQCPTCYEETYEGGLRNNRPLDEIIMVYLKMRDRLMRALRVASAASSPLPVTPASSAKSAPPPLPLVITPCPEPLTSSSSPTMPLGRPKENGVGGGKVWAQSRNQPLKKGGISCSLFPPISKSKTISEISKPSEDEPELVTRVVPQMFLSPKKKVESSSSPHRVTGNASSGNGATVDLSVCPVCDVQIPTRNINIHLDACLARSQQIEAPKPKVNKVNKREPLPKRLYNLMSDRDLKKSLKEFGLSTQGDRKVFIARLQRFTVLYNSENDSDKPRPTSELLLQVEREEREERKHAGSIMLSFQRMTVLRKEPIEVIEKVNKKYLDDNKYSFNKLIENMRQREGRNIKPTRPAQRIESDEDDDIRPITDQVQESQPSTSTSVSISKSSLQVNTSSNATPENKSWRRYKRKTEEKPDKTVTHLIDWEKTVCLEQDEGDCMGFEDIEGELANRQNEKTNNQFDLNTTLNHYKDEGKEQEKDVEQCGPVTCTTSGIATFQDDGAFYSSVFQNDSTTTAVGCDESSCDSVFEFTSGSSTKRSSVVSSTPQDTGKKRGTKLSRSAAKMQIGDDDFEDSKKIMPAVSNVSGGLLASPQMFSDTECQDSDIDVSHNIDDGEEETGTLLKGDLSLNEIVGSVCKSEPEGKPGTRRRFNRKRKNTGDTSELSSAQGGESPVEDEGLTNRRRSLRKRVRNAKFSEAGQ